MERRTHTTSLAVALALMPAAAAAVRDPESGTPEPAQPNGQPSTMSAEAMELERLQYAAIRDDVSRQREDGVVLKGRIPLTPLELIPLTETPDERRARIVRHLTPAFLDELRKLPKHRAAALVDRIVGNEERLERICLGARAAEPLHPRERRLAAALCEHGHGPHYSLVLAYDEATDSLTPELTCERCSQDCTAAFQARRRDDGSIELRFLARGFLRDTAVVRVGHTTAVFPMLWSTRTSRGNAITVLQAERPRA